MGTHIYKDFDVYPVASSGTEFEVALGEAKKQKTEETKEDATPKLGCRKEMEENNESCCKAYIQDYMLNKYSR